PFDHDGPRIPRPTWVTIASDLAIVHPKRGDRHRHAPRGAAPNGVPEYPAGDAGRTSILLWGGDGQRLARPHRDLASASCAKSAAATSYRSAQRERPPFDHDGPCISHAPCGAAPKGVAEYPAGNSSGILPGDGQGLARPHRD